MDCTTTRDALKGTSRSTVRFLEGRSVLKERAMAEEENTGPKTYPADKARQGEIILRTPVRRAIFVGGMLAALALVLIAQYLYLH
jgi:hypothetical protein